eukprot:jgi/Ulvmu1/3069/UM015_0109.1
MIIRSCVHDVTSHRKGVHPWCDSKISQQDMTLADGFPSVSAATCRVEQSFMHAGNLPGRARPYQVICSHPAVGSIHSDCQCATWPSRGERDLGPVDVQLCR